MSAELDNLSLFCLEVARCANRVQSTERLLGTVDDFSNPAAVEARLRDRLQEDSTTLRERAERLHGVLGDWLEQDDAEKECSRAESYAKALGFDEQARAIRARLAAVDASGIRRGE